MAGRLSFVARMTLAGFAWLGIAACDDARAPKVIEASAQPGAAVVIPFDRPVKGGARALSLVPATARVSPMPLPQDAEIVYSALRLFGSGDVAGDLLITVPENAEGEIAFALSAHGSGRGQTGSAVSFSTDPVDVRIAVSGAPVDDAPPALAGAWMSDEWTWEFEDGAVPILHRRRHDSAETTTIRYRAHPDGQGGWFLVEYALDGAAYWVAIDNTGVLSVSHLDVEFEPYLALTRAP